MVYYHTSSNVKMIRNILIDYGTTKEITPYEYIQNYIQQCPESIEHSKLSWISETFLSIQKHTQMLKEIAAHLSEELTEEEQDYFMIIFHAVTFQIRAKDMQLLYKCLFNISKPLLNTFTNFLSNNEVLTFISQVAQGYYDTDYITEKIVGPLFEWQPYISEMAHSYAEYVKKVENRKIKPLTVPIQPNVLNRKGKEVPPAPPSSSFPITPPNSIRTKTKMLTKSAIDRRLKNIHEKNKQKAANLLNIVKNQDSHLTQPKPKRFSDVVEKTENDFPKSYPKPKPKCIFKIPAVPIKDTVATIKRMNKQIQLTEQEEIKWLETVMFDCRNRSKIEELEAYDRQERERERLLDIEKKHLMGQISHEEAVIAKKKAQEENKKKYEEFLKEKEMWNEEIEKWKKIQMEKSHKIFEKNSLIELAALEAKNASLSKKKETAGNIRKESEELFAKVMKEKQEELDRRVNMIREIKILAMIAKKARVPKIIDLTETSGLGLLCEMSMAELQEKLSAMKIGIKEELDRKKILIKEENIAAKQELEEVKNSIKNYISERATKRKIKTSLKTTENPYSKEIDALKKILEEKRRLRVQLTS